MIVWMWHGRVPTAKAAAYREFTNGRAIPDYRSVPGNLSVHILERAEGEVTHLITLTFWESLDAVRRFAGMTPRKRSTTPRTRISCSNTSHAWCTTNWSAGAEPSTHRG